MKGRWGQGVHECRDKYSSQCSKWWNHGRRLDHLTFLSPFSEPRLWSSLYCAYYVAKPQKDQANRWVGIVKAPFKRIRNPDGVARGGPEVHICSVNSWMQDYEVRMVLVIA
jgi:hypothetical protein